MKVERKAVIFLTALLDVYKDEERRELEAFEKLELTNDATEDFTAMLLAMKTVFGSLTGSDDMDLIDFTHVLNKLAIQYVMDGDCDVEEK
jgi:two-component sensor histidine kinase